MVQSLERSDLASHARTYHNFVFGVRLIVVGAAAALILMAMYLV